MKNFQIQKIMVLKIKIGNQIAKAILYDNPTSLDFSKLLPLNVELKEYSNTEKIFTPSKKLSLENAPKGFKPSIGDLTYYAPWGNIALFYKDFNYATGLVPIGKITQGIELFFVNDSLKATFELE